MEIGYKNTVTFRRGWDADAIRETVMQARRIALVAHTNADGDAAGSVLGMYHLLKRATTAVVTPMLPDGVPDELKWLPGAGMIVDGKRQGAVCRCAFGSADLIICLDLNDPERTGALADALRQSTAKKMLVDHHEGRTPTVGEEWDVEVREADVSSTCELVYWTMQTAFGDEVFSRDAASCLYAGICTDTGTFSYSNDRGSLYLAAANLLKFGIDPMEINRQIKNVFTLPRLRFFGHAIAELLTTYPEQEVALMVIGASEMRRYGVESAELTGLINEVMRLREIDCGILIREEEGKVRLSLRSKRRYDVNRIANELFGGGGHKFASGCTIKASVKQAVGKILAELRKIL